VKVVVDANIIISLLIAKGSKHKLFFSGELDIISPDIILFEIGKHWDEISEKSRLSKWELNLEFSAVREQMMVFSVEKSKWIKEGVKISPDPDDAEYFALALKFNCPIWSEDKPLKQQQSKVEVMDTRKLLEKLGLIPV